ncbi:MAG: murein L,D-transpeptidase YafK [Porticoccus sp.]|jgi:murein L,D-transpeptidase YafK
MCGVMTFIRKSLSILFLLFLSSRLLALETGLPSVIVLSDHIVNVVAVDLHKGLFSLLEHKDGELSLVKTVPTSIGKQGFDKFYEGDKKTPIGIYKIVDYKPDNAIGAKYGIAAFPLDYPNVWDQKRSRTGSGIWIHGMYKEMTSRPKRDSDGCIVLNNDDLYSIFDQLLDKNTPVILAENAPLEELIKTNSNDGFVDVFDNWISTWESRDIDKYLDFYSADFDNKGKNFSQWAAHKRRVNRQKTFIDVDVKKLSVFDYPSEENLRLVEFYQDYQSNNYNSAAWKRQFWSQTDGNWQIVYEDTYR